MRRDANDKRSAMRCNAMQIVTRRCWQPMYSMHDERSNVGQRVAACRVPAELACWLRCFSSSQRGRTSCATRDVVFIATPSPAQRRFSLMGRLVATRTPHTNHPAIRPARCRWPVDHVVHVPSGALRVSDDGIRFENADPFPERKTDTLRTLLS